MPRIAYGILLSLPCLWPVPQAHAFTGIPPTVATVADEHRTSANGLPDIILIQDVHRHEEVQSQITAILLYGAHAWDIQNVYLEGIDQDAPSASHPLAPMKVHGLEKPSLYKQHVSAYARVESRKKAALRELEISRLLSHSFDTAEYSEKEYALLKRMLRLRMKPADYADYLHLNSMPRGSYLTEALSAAEDFYTLADDRSKVFAEALALYKGDGPVVAVVGGFHTQKMAEEFKRLGKSYVVLSPHVTESGYDDAYSRGMEQTISALHLR